MDEVDVVIVGGGIAGGALATALARGGQSVTVLERSTEYKDRVRGEYMQPWGVADAQRLGVFDTLLEAGGNVITKIVPYDELLEPSLAESFALPIDSVVPGAPGALGIGHPAACGALSAAATNAGATVVRGVEQLDFTLGAAPSVRWSINGTAHEVSCRLVVGADGRESAVRRHAGVPLNANPARLLGAGLVVDDAPGWPTDTFTVGSEDDRVFFMVPLGNGRVRLYLLYDARDKGRFAGASKAERFLAGFALRSVPIAEEFCSATPAGPCAVYPMNDSWCDDPAPPGAVLIGDAAGYSDPHIGQGLSVAMRDARVVSELLADSADWSPATLKPYVEERTERMRRLRFVNEIMTAMRAQFDEEGRAMRRRAMKLMQQQPEFALFRAASLVGPEKPPPEAFDEAVRERLLAP